MAVSYTVLEIQRQKWTEGISANPNNTDLLQKTPKILAAIGVGMEKIAF